MNSRTTLLPVFILFICCFYTVSAQKPEAIQYKGALESLGGLRSAPCALASAGTFKITRGSNNNSNNTKYLCFGDLLSINHNPDAKFGDPNPATIPGIGYAFYDCKPSVDGPNLTTVLKDACLNKTSPIDVNGTQVNQTQGMWVARETTNGFIEFDNDGHIQNEFNGGRPIQFWFAAITLDHISTNPFFENDVNNVAGPCIAVNVDSAFSVVYLNAVQLFNVTGTNNGTNNFTGTFTVTGGLPEFDPTANYTKVSIVNRGDPNKIGKLTNGPAVHGKPMTFSVPTPGIYDIIIEDVNGCQVTSFVKIDDNPGLIKVGCADGKIGDEICYTISIGQIPDLTSAQFTVAFNTQVLEYIEAKNLNPAFGPDINQTVITNDLDKGFVKFFWFQFNLEPQDFTIETPVVQLCFRIKGPPGTSTFRIVPNPGGNLPRLELSNLAGNSIPLSTATGSVFECTSNIFPASTLDAYYNQCGKTLFGQVFGGTGPYLISYKSLADTAIHDSIMAGKVSALIPVFANLPGGKYEIAVIDSVNAKVIDTVTIDPNLKNIAVDLTNYTPPTCQGGDGRIAAVPVGGSAPYRFQWSNGGISATINQLNAGKYSVTITDNSGCHASDSIILSKQDVLSAIKIETLPTCTGVSDGLIRADYNIIMPSGAVPTWIGGDGIKIGNAYKNLSKGRIGLIVSDAKGCSDTSFVDLGTQKDIVADITVDNNVRCFGNNDGRLKINRSFSDHSPLAGDMVTLTNPLNVVKNDALRPAIFNDLNAGSYKIHIQDNSGCLFDSVVQLTQPNLLDTINVKIKVESCFPGKDGSISIPMTGGTGPYRYTWSDIPDNVSSRANLTSGNYQVTITDANNCPTKFNTNLKFPSKLPVVPVSIDTTAILCFGQGAALTAKPGTGFTIKSYKWSNGDTLITAKNILANIPAWVEVTDIQGCKGSDTVRLSQPSKMRLIDSTILNSPCPGLDQGRISVLASGATGPYLYSLTGGPAQNFGQFSKLKPGKYTVTITDANQCPGLIISPEIVDPPKIVGVFDTVAFRGVRCAGTGDCTGQARLLLSGGTDPLNRFRVRWESNEVTENSIISTADSLCAGSQKVSITDGLGCNTSLQFTITSPDFISRDQSRTTTKDIICAGMKNGSVNYVAVGGTSPYKFQWSDNDSTGVRNGLAAGKYLVTVTDLNNCTFIDSVKISEPPALLITLDSVKTRSITCQGSADGQIGIKVTGGNAGKLVYNWSPSNLDSNFIRNVKPGVFTVSVTDNKGCKDSIMYTMQQPTPILPVLNVLFTPKCANDTAGIFVTSVSGGNGASYSYSINNGTSIPIANRVSLKAGTYQLTVFDRKGCAVDTSIKVIDPPKFNIDLGPDKTIRLGDSILITTIGNNPLSKVTWQDAEAVTCLSADCSIVSLRPVRSTIFTGSALDQSGCKATDQISIAVDERRAVYIPNAFRPDQLSINQDFRFFSGSGVIAIHYGRIFNRWGDIISEVQNLPPDAGGVVIWDGRFKGTSADAGVYVYAIDVEFSDGVRLVYKGDVTLIR